MVLFFSFAHNFLKVGYITPQIVPYYSAPFMSRPNLAIAVLTSTKAKHLFPGFQQCFCFDHLDVYMYFRCSTAHAQMHAYMSIYMSYYVGQG